MRKLFIFVLLLAALPAAAWPLNYLSPAIDFDNFIPPPNPNGSQANNDELKIIEEVQAAASKELKDKARAEAVLKADIMATALGQGLTRNDQPELFGFLDKIGDDCTAVTDRAKSYWHAERPYQLDENIKTLVMPPVNHSYPSGHAACTRVWAEVLSQIFPAKSEALRAKAKESAYFRLVAGIHYPKDIASGEKLGLIIFGALQQSQVYQNELAKIKSKF